jgi:hypothetical protein
MKRLLLVFLAFVILLPGFACAMPVCGMEKGGHCPHHMDKSHGLMLMQDCTKTDFQKAPDVACKKPDLGKDAFVIVTAAIPPANIKIADAGFVRGPPPDWPSASRTRPSIILTTQRFRK